MSGATAIQGQALTGPSLWPSWAQSRSSLATLPPRGTRTQRTAAVATLPSTPVVCVTSSSGLTFHWVWGAYPDTGTRAGQESVGSAPQAISPEEARRIAIETFDRIEAAIYAAAAREGRELTAFYDEDERV